MFVAPWGWTWVDAEPWGFAPFHYGRWAFVGGYWGWVPGPVAVRAVYAPALVGFVGGGGFGVSVAFGGGVSGVAWFPLGPRDVFVPGYRCSPRYVQNVNITNTRVINVTQVTTVYNNVYVNHNSTVINNYTYARNDRAVTAVSRDTFVNARPVVRRDHARVGPTDSRRASSRDFADRSDAIELRLFDRTRFNQSARGSVRAALGGCAPETDSFAPGRKTVVQSQRPIRPRSNQPAEQFSRQQ